MYKVSEGRRASGIVGGKAEKRPANPDSRWMARSVSITERCFEPGSSSLICCRTQTAEMGKVIPFEAIPAATPMRSSSVAPRAAGFPAKWDVCPSCLRRTVLCSEV